MFGFEPYRLTGEGFWQRKPKRMTHKIERKDGKHKREEEKKSLSLLDFLKSWICCECRWLPWLYFSLQEHLPPPIQQLGRAAAARGCRSLLGFLPAQWASLITLHKTNWQDVCVNAAACYRPVWFPQQQDRVDLGHSFRETSPNFASFSWLWMKKCVVTVLHNQGLLFAGGDVHRGSVVATPLFAFVNKRIRFDTTLSAAAPLMTRFSRRIVQRLLGHSAVAALKDWNALCLLERYWWAACLSQLHLPQYGSFLFGHFLF